MITTTRIGKIARLPHSIREQLNLKLHDGIPAKSILPWLNSLTEVKAILATDFEHHPITKQNLSEWKQGGHRDWLLQFQASQFLQFTDPQSSSSSSSSSSSIPSAFAAPDSSPALPNDFTEHATRNMQQPSQSDPTHRTPGIHDTQGTPLIARLLLWTQLQYITMARHIDSETDPERKWNALRHFATDISRLRRSAIADDYLQIQRDWLALSQSNTADRKEKEFWKWTKRPDIEKKLFPDRQPGLTPEWLYEFEKATCLMDGPGPEIAELMAEVRIAKKLLELRKAREAEAGAKAAPNYDPNRPLSDTKVRLAGMPFEELFPTIPEKPLTETHLELDDDPDTEDSNDANSKGPAPSHQRSAGRAATGEEEAGREGQSQPGLPATPQHETAHNPADLPSGPSDPSDSSHQSDPVQPSPTESDQIHPDSPLNPEPNSTKDPF